MLDEGHLTDSQGRRVDFRNAIIVMTSNLGADTLASLPEVLRWVYDVSATHSLSFL